MRDGSEISTAFRFIKEFRLPVFRLSESICILRDLWTGLSLWFCVSAVHSSTTKQSDPRWTWLRLWKPLQFWHQFNSTNTHVKCHSPHFWACSIQTPRCLFDVLSMRTKDSPERELCMTQRKVTIFSLSYGLPLGWKIVCGAPGISPQRKKLARSPHPSCPKTYSDPRLILIHSYCHETY